MVCGARLASPLPFFGDGFVGRIAVSQLGTRSSAAVRHPLRRVSAPTKRRGSARVASHGVLARICGFRVWCMVGKNSVRHGLPEQNLSQPRPKKAVCPLLVGKWVFAILHQMEIIALSVMFYKDSSCFSLHFHIIFQSAVSPRRTMVCRFSHSPRALFSSFSPFI